MATFLKNTPEPNIIQLPVLLSNSSMNNLFEAVVETTEEAALNSLLAAKTTEGRDGNKAYQLPAERLRTLLQKHKVIE